jgi:DNA primase
MIPVTIKLEKINRLALRYFIDCFNESKRAQQYIYNRISKDTARKFLVGYAPRDGFVEYLNKHKVGKEPVKDLGLITLDYEDNAYPRYTNRVMIPIIHAQRVIGFGGRTLGNDEPKYLNSKASLLYNKKEVLYGLWATRVPIVKRGYAILVEGYFDVLTPYDKGLTNVVATCGTALTKEQAALLHRYTEKVYVMYDGDAPGVKAAKRAREILEKENVFAGIIKLPKEHDPASFIEKYGVKGLKGLKIRK